MPCALCGDFVPTEVARCPACGAWARRRDFRAMGIAVFMLLGFNAFIALGSGISLLRLVHPLNTATRDSYDPGTIEKALTPYSDVFMISWVLAGLTGVLYLGWLWRAHRQSGGPHLYRRAWVLFGWVVPIANLWLPPRLVHDVWVSSGRFRMAQRHAAGLVVTGWWVSLLAALALSEAFPSGTDTIGEARLSVQLGVAATALQALAAALCMAIVYQITRLQLRAPEPPR